MRITSAGKVFIGDTTASNAQLRVKQSTSNEWAANIINNQSVAYGLSIDTSSSASTAAFNFAAYTPAGTGFFVKNTGNVGIGTTAPGAKLHVNGGNIRISSTNDKPQLEFFETAAARWVIGHSNSPNNYFAISEGSDIAASERLVIAPTTGSVGIGTTTPDHKLHVAGTGQVAKIGDNHWRGTNTVTVGTTYVTGVTVNLTNNRGGYLKVIISGDWSGHSAIGYMSEYFIQKGSTTRYSQPGTVIREVTNQHNSDYITSQILDPTLNDGNADFAIQFKTNTGSVSCTVMYEFTGIANSVT
jgi:hypothetical protein